MGVSVRHRRGMWRVGTGALIAVAFASQAGAQVAPGVSIQAPADRRQPQTRLTREQAAPAAPSSAPGHSSVNVDRVLPTPDCPLSTSPARVNLQSVKFTGARLDGAGNPLPYPAEFDEILSAITVGETGDQPIANVCRIRDQANEALFRAGYIAAVEIPSQEINDGVLRLRVVSARITAVRVNGADGRLGADLRKRLETIREIDPLSQRELERRLLLARDVPGLTLSLSLEPAEAGHGDLIADVTVKQQHVALFALYQNTGSHQLGPSIFSVRGVLEGLTGLADETFIGVSQSTDFDEVHVFQAGHSLGLGTGGARLTLLGSYALSSPTIPDLTLKSRSVIASAEVSAPVYRALLRTGRTANDWDVYVAGGLEILNQRTVIRSGLLDAPFQRDRLRVLYGRAGFHLVSQNAAGQYARIVNAEVQLRKGLDILDATRLGVTDDNFLPSRFTGDPEAFVIRGDLDATIAPFALRRTSPSDAFTLELSLGGQWSNHALLNLEEFTIGNLTYGRGYDPGANAGDRAIAVRVSPSLRVFDSPRTFGLAERSSVYLTAFFDAVRFWNLDPGTTETNRTLRSVGGGLRVRLSNRVQLDALYAKPLDRALTTDTARPPARVLVTLTTKLVPWSDR